MRITWDGRLSLASLVVAAWAGVALLLGVGYGVADFGTFVANLSHFLPFYGIWAALTPAVFTLASWLNREKVTTLPALAGHAIAAFAVAAIQTAFYIPLERFANPPIFGGGLLVSIVEGFERHLPGNLLTYACVILVWHIAEARGRAAEALNRARLETLRRQLQPHFLFNALQAASALIRSDPSAAEEVLELLGDYLRAVLRDDRELVTLRDELALLDVYVRIMKARFGDRLRVDVSADPELRSAVVPVMFLQPLVENAITHGIGSRAAGGSIRIVVRDLDGELVASVHDDGAGIDPAANEGIGLSNTRRRLLSLYGDRHRIAMSSGPDGTTVEVRLPLEHDGVEKRLRPQDLTSARMTLA